MAPAVLLQPEEHATPYFSNAAQSKTVPKLANTEVRTHEVHAPAVGHGSTAFLSPSQNGNDHFLGINSGVNAPSRQQLDGREFVAAQALQQNGRPLSDESVKKPNILYIMADQMAAPLLKMNNPNSVIKTPNIDKLAETGVVFSNAYCNSPLCAPSRFTMCTGQLPSKIGGYDNASILSPDVPTYAHYLRREGYVTALAGKMHFIGPDQLHGFEHRLTSDVYPGDLGWTVNWDKPDERQEWYHNMSSVREANWTVASNELDYDVDVIHKTQQYLLDWVRIDPEKQKPFALTVSLTHPHDPYTMTQDYLDMYEGVDIPLPEITIAQEDQDSHSQRLLKTIDAWDNPVTEEAILRARKSYFAACSFVDDQVGKLMRLLRNCHLDQNTIIVFSGDHGDMLGERSLWYKMSWFEMSSRVPMLINYPARFAPKRVNESVSTMDLLPTFVDLAGGDPSDILPIDGTSLWDYLVSDKPGKDEVFGEYMGEGTITPTYMIRRGRWKYTTSLVDNPQLFDLVNDPKELTDLTTSKDPQVAAVFAAFEKEAHQKWDFKQIHKDALASQRRRRLVWKALQQGERESWDYQPPYNDRNRFIRSHIPLDELERRARWPPVDRNGRHHTAGVSIHGVAGAYGQ